MFCTGSHMGRIYSTQVDYKMYPKKLIICQSLLTIIRSKKMCCKNLLFISSIYDQFIFDSINHIQTKT